MKSSSTKRTPLNSRPREINNMLLGRAIGTVVATIKNPSLAGITMLVVQPLDRSGADKGRPTVPFDSVGAGTGETVFWCRGREASFPFPPVEGPTEATIVGIVDEVNLSKRLNN